MGENIKQDKGHQARPGEEENRNDPAGRIRIERTTSPPLGHRTFSEDPNPPQNAGPPKLSAFPFPGIGPWTSSAPIPQLRGLSPPRPDRGTSVIFFFSSFPMAKIASQIKIIQLESPWPSASVKRIPRSNRISAKNRPAEPQRSNC